MCGRFSLSGDIDFYADYFGVETASESIEPSWNVAPTDPVYALAERDHVRRIGTMMWGLIPHWANDPKAIQINARAETVARTPAFRDSFARKRCLIPADGFYEWEPKEKGRTPHWIFRADGYPMAMAGLWSSWKDPSDGTWVRTCAIITTKAEGVVAPLHNRMPVSLEPKAWDGWLDRDLKDPGEVEALLQAIDPDLLMEHAVSNRVNSVKNNGPELTAALTQARLI
jgi:putative SOS response-associated peptidase YedK